LKGRPVNEAPTSIKVTNKGVLSIWLNPESVKVNFGEDLIYGIASDPSDFRHMGFGIK
jgi:hypothetical protein